jgi:hypothetical protein
VVRLERDDLEAALAAGRVHLDLVADRFAHERPAERRRQRYLSLARVDLFGEHDLVGHGVALVDVLDGHAAAIGDDATRDRRDVVHRQLADAALELRDARAHEILPVLGGLVLRVLWSPARASSSCFGSRTSVVLERGELLLEASDDGSSTASCPCGGAA